MKLPQIPKNELERLDALLSYKVLDTHPEKDFDDITRLASEICDMPVSIITLLDENRQWFKSKIGLDLNETARDVSFCGHAINNPHENFIIENVLEDERFIGNPLVTGELQIRSYAGVPLVTPEGFALGTLCVIDNRVKKLDQFQITALEKLANQAMKLLELRRNNYRLTESHNSLSQRYKDLEQFSRVVSHDIKSPLNNIILLAKMIKEDHADNLNDNGKQMVDYIGESALQLKQLVDGILDYYKFDTLDVTERERIRLRDFTQYIISLLHIKSDIEFILPDEKIKFKTNKMAFGQILYNLIVNAIKYNDKQKGMIEISLEDTQTEHVISVKDNGIGIPESHFEEIFNIFTTLGKTDRFNQKGTGIGLSTVQKLTTKLGGRITLESISGEGSTFRIHLKK